MTAQTVPDQQVTDEALSRDEVYTSLMHGLNVGLPAPKGIRFHTTSVHIDLDSRADLMAWHAWFGMQGRSINGQPYPSLSDPADMAVWSSRTWMMWRGWHLALDANDPITAEQRDGWVSSGQAARFAELEAKQAAEAAGLDYSREPDEVDDPTPVSPAQGGAPHVVAMTDGGLVDETPAEASTLSAAIRFSEARREAFRLIGRTTSERLQAATLDLLHGQALSEDAERAQRADLRPGEQGRVTNPDLARFLAKKEEARREARHFLGLEESAKHYPVHAGPCWSDCNRSEHSVSESR